MSASSNKALTKTVTVTTTYHGTDEWLAYYLGALNNQYGSAMVDALQIKGRSELFTEDHDGSTAHSVYTLGGNQ